ncbi:Protein of unknown function DUF3632 [Lasallia pustulata]|uniref:Uncharacterized protein n=1 Tax=Lasallia pustulata TaxID=136370 RepID=A0A1W5CSY4_9LECA|nr:Protein of unknown function DUF3632 [Lasallia pustulata]
MSDSCAGAEGLLQQRDNRKRSSSSHHAADEELKDPGANLYHLWGLLVDALAELPITQIPALIQLLEAIQQLPEPDLTGRLTKSAPADGFLWRRLPGFGHMWVDEHKPDDWRRTLAGSDPTKGAQLRAQHARKAEIEAQVAVADSYNRVLDFEIPAAAKWIAIAGKRLHAGAVSGEESWILERQRDCGKECKSMNLERWSFWEERPKELFQQSEATQDAANSAIHEMKALDS